MCVLLKSLRINWRIEGFVRIKGIMANQPIRITGARKNRLKKNLFHYRQMKINDVCIEARGSIQLFRYD